MSDLPKDFDMDKLLNDIETDAAKSTDGTFLPQGFKEKKDKSLKYSKWLSYALFAIAAVFITHIVVKSPWSWFASGLVILATLFVAIFALTILELTRKRIKLLLSIENNTIRIAVSKERVARTLEKIQKEYEGEEDI